MSLLFFEKKIKKLKKSVDKVLNIVYNVLKDKDNNTIK